MGTDGSIVNIALLRQDFESTDNYNATISYLSVLYRIRRVKHFFFVLIEKGSEMKI